MTNEKGLFAQADLGIVSRSTTERKKMSTKTSFKRIALVAVASLGLGVLTSVSANAAAGDLTVTGAIVKGAASTTATTATGVVGNQVIFTYEEAIAGAATVYITSDAGGKIVSASSTAVGASSMGFINGQNLNDGGKWTVATTVAETATVGLSSTVAGTQVVKIQTITAATGIYTTIATLTVTWGAALAATSATAKLAAGNDCSAGAASNVYLAKASGVTLAAGATTGASLCLTVKDQNGTAMNGVPLDVTIAGPGLVSITSGATTAVTGTTRTASLTSAAQAAASTAAIGVSADGTAGTATVTVSTGTTVLATATVYFYGAAASISATQVLKVASSSGATLGANSAAPTGADSANSPAVIVSVKDKDGILIPGLTNANIKATSSDATVMSETLALTESTGAGAGNTTAKTYNVQVTSVSGTSGKTATLTFKILGADGETYVTSAPIKFALGGSVATVALSLDKASYSLGSAAVATLTAKDSSGNAAKDGVLATTLADKLVSSYSVNKDLFGASVDFIGGVATVSFNAPVITGAWTISGTTGTGPSTDKVKALTASATVTGGNDAAIASLISKINALSKLIAKIQKKLGIK
jgi:hypothetical protein